MKKLLLLLFVGSLSTSWGQYCLPTYGNDCTSGDYIESFSFNLINNANTGCANPGANNYTDYSATLIDAVQQGQTYSVTCAPGPSWGQYFAMWIDFNQDGDFDEVNEWFDIGYAAAGGSVTTPVTIPNGVAGGTTQLRILCHFGTGAIAQTDACIAQTWGECEDYGVVVGNPPPYDMATTSIDAPSTGCGLGMETVTATFQNNGSVTADTATFCYNINGGAWVCETVTGLGIASSGTYVHNFTTLADLSTAGDYYFNVSVSQVGDSTAVNDTIFNYMVSSVPTITGLPYSEDFEAGTGGWVPSGTMANWEYGQANEGNGGCVPGDSMVWATGLTTPYNNNTVSYLSSPCIDFSSLTTDPLMSFDHIYETETTFDAHFVEISIDGGATWTLLGGLGTGLNWYDNATEWEGLSNGWRKAAHVLTGTAGQSDVRIRFVLTSDGSVTYEGAAIDNINIDAATSFVDASPVQIDAPASGCGLTNAEMIMASFTNSGLDSLIGFDVCYTVNGGAPICETLTDTIAPGATYMHTFATTADFSATGDYNVELIITAGDLDQCNDTMSVLVINKPLISSYPYLEKFENGSGGWAADNTNNGTWELATPAGAVINGAFSGVNAWVTNATGDYNVNDNSSVESPCFDFTNLPNGSWAAMRVWWEAENSWDGANLQYSLDTAQTWTNLGAMGAPALNNWYNDNSISGAPGGSQEGWTGDQFNNGSGGWVAARHPLDDATFVGQPHVLFRVNFGSDGSVTREGVAFDNFAIGVPPTIDIGPDYVGCANYEIDPGLPGTYEWYGEDTSTLATTLMSTDDVGVFTNPAFFTDTTYNAIVVYTDSLGLYALDTAQLTLSPAPYNVLSDTTICYNDTVMYNVDAQAFYTYNWNNGSTVDSAEYIYSTGGLVEVIVLNTVSGCADTASAMIYQTPAVSIADVMACDGDTALIDATNAYSTYAWNTGDSLSVLGATTAGVYTVVTTDSIGCVSSDSATVTFNALPTPTIANLPDTLCEYNDVTVDGGAGFASYDWSTGGTSQSETISGSALGLGTQTIMLTVEDGNGCFGTTTETIVVDGCAGIDELNAANLAIYPNPSHGVFNFILDESLVGAEFILMDVLGKVIWSENISTLEGEIDLTSYESGTYLLKVVKDEFASTARLVKE